MDDRTVTDGGSWNQFKAIKYMEKVFLLRVIDQARTKFEFALDVKNVTH